MYIFFILFHHLEYIYVQYLFDVVIITRKEIFNATVM